MHKTKLLMAVFLLLPVAGCGSSGDRPELGEVTGTVTLNGEPLAYCGVHFTPDLGRVASGYTGKDGKYEITYIKYPRQVMGAKIGNNKVVITTNVDASDLEGVSGADLKEDDAVKEKVPACYRGEESILKVTVAEGGNVINFDLTDDCKPTGVAM